MSQPTHNEGTRVIRKEKNRIRFLMLVNPNVVVFSVMDGSSSSFTSSSIDLVKTFLGCGAYIFVYNEYFYSKT
jgi:hypothetical protein